MNKPPEEYYIVKKFIDEEKMPLSGYFYFLIRIPKNLIEWLIRDLPGPIGVITRRLYYKLVLKKVGKNVVIDEAVYFQGSNIELDDWCYVEKFCVLRSYSGIRIGKRVHLGIGIVMYAGLDSEIEIDDHSTIGTRSSIYSVSNAYAPNKRMGGPMCKSNQVETKYGSIHIGKDCFVGIGSTILPGVSIGFGSIIMAHALIKKNINSLGIYDQKGLFIIKREFDKGSFTD